MAGLVRLTNLYYWLVFKLQAVETNAQRDDKSSGTWPWGALWEGRIYFADEICRNNEMIVVCRLLAWGREKDYRNQIRWRNLQSFQSSAEELENRKWFSLFQWAWLQLVFDLITATFIEIPKVLSLFAILLIHSLCNLKWKRDSFFTSSEGLHRAGIEFASVKSWWGWKLLAKLSRLSQTLILSEFPSATLFFALKSQEKPKNFPCELGIHLFNLHAERRWWSNRD